MQISWHKHYDITHKSFLQRGARGPSSLTLSSGRLDGFEPSVSPGWRNFSHFSLIMLHFPLCQGVKPKHNKTAFDIPQCQKLFYILVSIQGAEPPPPSEQQHL